MNLIICEAIAKRQLLSFTYDQKSRKVEPYCYGISTAGNEVLRAWQIDAGWRMFKLDKVSDITILNEAFAENRKDYTRYDLDFKFTYAQI